MWNCVTEGRDEVSRQFRGVAIVYAEAEFEQRYADFRQRYPACGRYLNKNVEVPKWENFKFPVAKYNIDISNCVES